jgi:hypothetical protein
MGGRVGLDTGAGAYKIEASIANTSIYKLTAVGK